MRLSHSLPALFCLLALAGCGSKTLTLSSFDGSKTARVTVEIADSSKERERGLMYREEKLAAGQGMIFAFPAPKILSFWMKETLIPLEILFFDAKGEFINALQMVPCTLDPCAVYKSQALAQFALEVNPDFRKANEVGTGWKMDLEQVRGMVSPR